MCDPICMAHRQFKPRALPCRLQALQAAGLHNTCTPCKAWYRVVEILDESDGHDTVFQALTVVIRLS
jgi:hypothetical protein